MGKELYDKLKNIPNPSKGLLSAIKKSSSNTIWMVGDINAVGKKRLTAKQLKKLPLTKARLIIGVPDSEFDLVETTATRITGYELRACMFFQGKRGGLREHVVRGTEANGSALCVDVTAAVVEALLAKGSCAISPYHCEMHQVSKRVRKCAHCGRKQKAVTVVTKVVTWENV